MLLLILCGFLCLDGETAPIQKEVDTYLAQYTQTYLDLYYKSALAEWDANTKIIDGDDSNQKKVEAANEAMAQFTGSTENIEKTRAFLAKKDQLSALQVRQLEAILYAAANNPQTIPELVKKRIAAEAVQNENLFGFDFQLNGKSVSTNELDDILVDSTDLKQRLEAWTVSKAVGPTLKAGLVDLVKLRNETVQALGYKDYFDYQVSAYGMSSEEMMAMMDAFIRELRPLYRELHTWARYELAKKYGTEVPDQLPAHWLPNRWGQDWSEMLTVEGFDLDAALADKSAEWVVQQGEAFYVSLGFPKLPQTFWDKSSLYPLPADATYKKNNHASAWHLDLQNDVRSLMSVQNNARWYS
ncbi:MAG: M2 family metallopeptidase, partial [Acidobacteria bacterium]|nr:M2 family metallopeptidase [Acidobacteriota bacterium]